MSLLHRPALAWSFALVGVLLAALSGAHALGWLP